MHIIVAVTLRLALLLGVGAAGLLGSSVVVSPAYSQSNCSTGGAPAQITGVSGITAGSGRQAIVIIGTNFGCHSPYNGNSPDILITDTTQGWNAGCQDRGDFDDAYQDSCIYDTVTLDVAGWITDSDQNSEIDLYGFTGDYGNCCRLYAGDSVTIKVWNTRNDQQTPPSSYTLIVSAAP